jgi:hypothetical protein
MVLRYVNIIPDEYSHEITVHAHVLPFQIEDVQELEDSIEDPTQLQSAAINVQITASFPESEVFGVKLVNGRPSRAVLDVANGETEPVTVLMAGGSLVTPNTPGAPDPPVIVRNLTAQRYGVQIPAGEKQSLTYSFATELHPQDLRLNIATVLQSSEGKIYTQQVYNETVSVVEAPISFFDPQM